MTPQQFVAVLAGIKSGCDAQVAMAQLAESKLHEDELYIIHGFAAQAHAVSVLANMAIEEIQKQVTTGNHEDKNPAPCQHPEEERIPMAVMGHPHRFQCNMCKEVVD